MGYVTFLSQESYQRTCLVDGNVAGIKLEGRAGEGVWLGVANKRSD